MRKLLTFALTILLLLSTSPIIKVSAIANAPLACSTNQYSVDRITGKDQFTNLACFNENQFTEALAAMDSYAAQAPNVVVRHDQSYSPLNIVAADRAMAYSQNNTYLASSTMDVWRNKERTIPYTYVSQANPFYYYQTVIQNKASTDTIRPSDLSVEVEVNGARGFVPLNGVDIIPLIYVENRINNWYISFTTRSVENVYSGNIIKPNITYYEVKSITSNTSTGNVSLREVTVRIDYALTAATYELGLAPDWLANGIYYSPDGIHFYTDMDLTQPVLNNGVVGEYYNYYQYLNLRTKTNYTGAELDAYFNYFASVNPTYLTKNIQISTMKNQGNSFVNAQDTYGMNALIIYAMAAHESAYGTSNYAVNYNNLFGYGAYDSNPSNAANYSYPTVADGVNQHMGLNLRYYLDYSNYNATAGTSLFYASNIGNKGAGINTRYASDPWWSIKIAQWSFKIDRYLGLKDFNYHQIGILNDSLRTVYSDPNASSSLYTVNTRATNYPLNILSTYNNNTYKIQSTNPIQNGTLITSSTPGLVTYDWTNSYSYVLISQSTLANTASNTPTIESTDDTLLTYVSNWQWSDTNLYIKGWSALQYTNMANTSVTHQLNIVNLDDATQIITVPLSIATANYELNIGNSFNYSSAWFEGTIEIGSLSKGNYRFEIITSSNDITGTAILSNSTVNAPRAEVKIINNKLYRFSFNNTRSMRYELLIQDGISYSDLTPLLPTRFNSTAYLTDLNFSTENNIELLDITGISFMQNVQTGPTNSVSHKLVLVHSNGQLYSFDLLSSTGAYDLSNNNIDLTHAWFSGIDINISTLPDGVYSMYILTSSSGYKDLVEVRDLLIRNTQTKESSLYTYVLNTNTNVRRIYTLTKTIK